MRRQLAALAAERHVHKVFLVQQTLEGGDEVGLVVVPAEGEPLVGPHPGALQSAGLGAVSTGGFY